MRSRGRKSLKTESALARRVAHMGSPDLDPAVVDGVKYNTRLWSCDENASHNAQEQTAILNLNNTVTCAQVGPKRTG